MILHHTVLHETGAAARLLIREFEGHCNSDPITFITWVSRTRPLDHEAPGETTFELGPDEAITANFDAKGRNYTVILYQDPDGKETPFVTLIENRKAPTSTDQTTTS
jgi:hypothetical protein